VSLQKSTTSHWDETASDERIVADFIAREPRGLEAAYRRHATALYSVALGVLRDSDDAQDCVHDALLRVWQRAGSYRRERGPLRAFLMACVRNEALSRLRARERRARLEGVAQAGTPQSYEGEFSDPLESARLRAALASLPDEQRTAVQLAYGNHLTRAQIAERLAVPLGTVKSRVTMGLRRLGTLLAAPGAPPEAR